MPELKCGVNSCVYNYNQLCSKSAIKVSGADALREKETSCLSYHKRDREANDHYNLEIGTIEDIISDYLSVNCEAFNCVYNRNALCYAKDIKIDGTKAKHKHDTFCSSFLLK